jgi:hypothetical protein
MTPPITEVASGRCTSAPAPVVIARDGQIFTRLRLRTGIILLKYSSLEHG